MINKSVPYFKKYENNGTSYMNKEVYKVLDDMSFSPLDTFSKNNEHNGLEKLPDGMIEIGKANKENLNYRIQMNDYSIF